MIRERKEAKKLKNQSLSSRFSYDESLKEHLDPDHYGVVLLPASQLTYKFMADMMVRFIQQRLGKELKDVKILDWGCGKGQLSYFLYQAGCRNITLAEVKDYPHTKLWDQIKPFRHLVLTHPSQIDAPSKTYDVIVSAGVLEHVPNDAASLAELQRIMADNGLMFCFNLPSSTGLVHHISNLRGDNYHDRLYSKREVRQLLKRSGLKPLVLYRRQLLPKKALGYSNPQTADKIDNTLSQIPLVNLGAASLEFVAVNQNCHLQAG